MLRTPFYKQHVEKGAKFVDFAGWEMPIMYGSILDEHRQVRSAGGVFDVSHMGRIKISGRDARRLLETLLTRRVSDMKDYTCRYSLICNERGGTRDDVLIYRYPDDWLLVVNAANREKILTHMQAVAADLKVKIDDRTQATGMLAIQGPKVIEQIARFSSEVPALKRYAFCEKGILIVKLTISRTGYTGEDGVEVIMPAKMPAMALNMLMNAGGEEAKKVLAPAGLGARDTLRLEAGMCLYGHELSEEIDPLTAGLEFAVALDKGETAADREAGVPRFIGQNALQQIAAAGPKRKLIGLKLEGRRTARQGMTVSKADKPIGEITSGCLSPTLGYPIAMALVDAGHAGEGDELTIMLGDKAVAAAVTPLPFYKRGK